MFLLLKPFESEEQEAREGRGSAIYDLGRLGARLDLPKGFEIEFRVVLTDSAPDVRFERMGAC